MTPAPAGENAETGNGLYLITTQNTGLKVYIPGKKVKRKRLRSDVEAAIENAKQKGWDGVISGELTGMEQR